ncbi:zinc ABC transporter substrate-binding protein [Thalassospiraceae bacterium LMO-JJ14]|nr:zinc ABC transporter substrate-binding protein [Thalassospiraceae bacterium LMO-JJ14]
MRTPFVIGVLALCLSLRAVSATAEPVRVVTTIKPVHSLVSMVLAGVAEPYLIVRGASSPHGFAMRPSDARALAHADVIFWVGPELETFMIKPLETLPASARVVAFVDDDDAHGKENGAHEHQGHLHSDGEDLHIWLDPAQAVEMIEQIAATMSAALPAQAPRIKKNTADAIEQLISVDAEVRRLVAPLQDDYLVVLHDAYDHFTHHFGLLEFIALSVTPEHEPGPGKISEIRRKISDYNVRCVFAEPQFSDTFVRLLIEGTGAKAAEIDPLGAQLMPGPELYLQLLRHMGFALRGCFEETS